jgi:transcription elongation factor Elf1
MTAKPSMLSLVPNPPTKKKTPRCPECRSRKVSFNYNPEQGTWFGWYICENCGHSWQTDEPFPGRVISCQIFPAS